MSTVSDTQGTRNLGALCIQHYDLQHGNYSWKNLTQIATGNQAKLNAVESLNITETQEAYRNIKSKLLFKIATKGRKDLHWLLT